MAIMTAMMDLADDPVTPPRRFNVEPYRGEEFGDAEIATIFDGWHMTYVVHHDLPPLTEIIDIIAFVKLF